MKLSTTFLGVLALLTTSAGIARADHAPELLDRPDAGFTVEAHWKASRTWAPHARLPIAMSDAQFGDALIVQHLSGGVPWGDPQRCPSSEISGGVIVFECAALDVFNTEELGSRGMTLSYVHKDSHQDNEFVTVFYNVERFQR